jgi:glutamate N-acetyltransferase/amino-acid N-acetyltransferase
LSTPAGVTAPRGFRAASVAAGLKPGRDDLALIVADSGCAAAGVFTANLAQAAPVIVSREHLAAGTARAVVVNAGCANAATGERGLRDAREMAACTAAAVGCDAPEVVVASTGVIGVPLPMDRVRAGISAAAASLSTDGGRGAARAILTTDTRPKETLVEFALDGHMARVGGMAKGAGMIAPHMATMLAFFTTDAAVHPALLRRALAEAVGESFNRITVDGDTSTNDMAVVLASGALPARAILEADEDYAAFSAALHEAARQLALLIVRDGEGATRACEVRVEGAGTAAEADRIARTIAESPLFKTALHGGDPNWGRILAAAGRAGVAFDVGRVDIFLGEVWVCERGAARAYDEALAHAAISEDPARVRVRVGDGPGRGHVWTCDFSRAYVDINAHYRS